VLSVYHHLPRALLVLCWMGALAKPAAAVMPSPVGAIPAEVVQAFDARLFELPPRADRLGTSAVQTVWNIPVLLVGFSDQQFSTTIYGGRTPTQHFDRTLFDTTGVTSTGSVFDYYQWVSGERIRVVGKVVASLTLPQTKSWYANNNWGLGQLPPQNTYGFVTSALQYADSSIDWRPFDQDNDGFVDMLWVVHSGLPGEATVAKTNLWSITSRLSAWSLGESFETRTLRPGGGAIHMRVDRFSVMPEISSIRPGQPVEIGVYCHEFGHALGLPDLYDTSTFGGGDNLGTGNWSLMGTGGYGGDGSSPEYPSHLGAWPLRWLGWGEFIRPENDTLMVQGSLESGAPVVEFWFQGDASPQYFLIENRQREGFDRNLPGEGLIIYQVDETVMTPPAVAGNRINTGCRPGLRLLEADGLGDIVAGRNRGESRDPFPGYLGRTEFNDGTVPSTRAAPASCEAVTGALTDIALGQIELVGDDVRYLVQVRAPGWEAAVSTVAGSFEPIWPSGAANRALSTADGSVLAAITERRAGRSQIILHSRSRFGPWGDPIEVSESPGSATDPSIAALPGGSDLVVTWSDSRHGAGELYYRSRIGGVWSPERRLTELAGDSRYPSMGVDRFGRVHLAWLYTEGVRPRVHFMTFTYYSPFGMSVAVTPTTVFPEAPVVAVAPSGESHIFWSDRATSPTSVWFSRYGHSTGLTSPQPVATGIVSNQPTIDASVDATGTVHVVWQVTGSAGSVNQIHYQKRPPNGAIPSPIDSVIISRSESVQNPIVRVDERGAVHVGFIAINGGVPQVRYKRGHPERGWDYGSTEITMVSEGGAGRPMIVPGRNDEVSVLYFLPTLETDRLMERRRFMPVGALAAPEPLRLRAGLDVRLAPNPLRAGAPLALRIPGDMLGPGSVIELFDLAGRKVASTPLVPHAGDLSAEIPGTITRGWQSGVYFARVRGGRALGARLVVLR
jgi:M6 family metalloprotease-like protein